DNKDNIAAKVECEVNYPLGAFGRRTAPEQAEWVLIKQATLWTCAEAGVLQNSDLLLHRGRIEAIGQGLEAPPAARVIDAQGMHLTPGIIDCHSHMATDGGVNESAQAVTAEVRIGDFIDSNDISIYRQLAGGVTTANILHGSANPIGGQNQVIKLRWGSLDEELKMKEAPPGIKFALGENVKQSNREGRNTRYPQTRMGVEQLFRDRFEAAKLYRQRWHAWRQAPSGLPPRRDLELEAIAECVEGTRWIHCHSYRQDEILMMLRTLDDYGITIGTLQHILEGYKVADAMAAHGAMGSSFSDWWAYKFEVFDAIPFNGALMHRAGVVVSFNSDDAELARHLNHEAAKAVKYGGLEPNEALKFVTLNPAKQLRIDQWVGSLEVGKQADFVLWKGSPLSTLSVCMQTWIEGRKYFDRQEDQQRREEDARLHRQLVQAIVAQGAGKNDSDSDDKDPSLWWARYDEFCHHGHAHDEHTDDRAHQHD
ncbi:MAG: amidohydrolase, partial [Planctomycetales bacterium]|nr:amidohydrolase [Planctomycetales bacterium]